MLTEIKYRKSQLSEPRWRFCFSHNRKCIFNAGLMPNIKENPRSRKRPKRGLKKIFKTHAIDTLTPVPRAHLCVGGQI